MIILFLARKVIIRIFIHEKIANFAQKIHRFKQFDLKMGHHQIDILDEQILKLIAGSVVVPDFDITLIEKSLSPIYSINSLI